MPLIRDTDAAWLERRAVERFNRHTRILIWAYGIDRACAMIERRDPALHEDIGRWYALGNREG